MTKPDGAAPPELRSIEAFLFHEARLLDERHFEQWMELFTEEGYYWAPARPDQRDPWSEVSLMFDDRSIMRNRIKRLRHPRVYAQIPPARAVRQVSNVSIESFDASASELTTRAVFFMFEHRPTLPEPMQRIFAGEYQHCLVTSAGTFRIKWKKALLANCDATFDPLFLYF
jgi:benzoate/toluate 1,2-dioxygenase beta subunit